MNLRLNQINLKSFYIHLLESILFSMFPGYKINVFSETIIQNIEIYFLLISASTIEYSQSIHSSISTIYLLFYSSLSCCLLAMYHPLRSLNHHRNLLIDYYFLLSLVFLFIFFAFLFSCLKDGIPIFDGSVCWNDW